MKKIMFNDKYGLTQAVLAGRKTMTRRLIPEREIEDYQVRVDDFLSIGFGDIPVEVQSFEDAMICRSKYSVGDVVAISQSYKDVNKGGYPVDSRYDAFRTAYSVGSVKESDKGWCNKMFVRADIMPHQIRITNVKVERLQDISDEDCLKEGVFNVEDGGRIIGHPFGMPFHYTFFGAKNKDGKQLLWTTPREAFEILIDKISGIGTWEANPWVFAYSFELVK